MDPEHESIDRVAKLSGLSVIGMLLWIDPTGQRWMAPLGSPEPDLDRPIPPEWVPIKVMNRRDDIW